MNKDFTVQYKEAWELISTSAHIVIIPHHNPDGDAIGSALAVYNLLINAGKNVEVVSPNHYPDFLKWLPGNGQVIIYEENREAVAASLQQADLLIFTDFNCMDRIDPLSKIVEPLSCKKILIDHHPEPEQFADVIISDTSVCSTAELVLHFIEGSGLKAFLNKEVASCLLTGIMTDTGSFSFNSSNPETFMAVAELLKYGVDKDSIFSSIYNNYSEDRMNLLGFCLHNKMTILPEFRTGFIAITQEELDRFNFEPGDTEGFVNYPLSVRGFAFAALFIERDDYIKISFRSKGSFPANQFSGKHFNGGGHLNAAGGNSELTMKETLIKFQQLLPRYKEGLIKSN